ncbi:hypothetical protein Tco_0501983 [Tanacetum coccineum]
MVLQLTDFTSEITDEELLEFTSEYYIPFALQNPVSAAERVRGSICRGKSVHKPQSYSMEDAELINAATGVHPLRDGEEPLLESTAGRTMELVLEQPEFDSTDVLAPTPLRSVPGAAVEPPRPDATSVGSSEDADVVGAESEAEEVDSGLKMKKGHRDDCAGTSKRCRLCPKAFEVQSSRSAFCGRVYIASAQQAALVAQLRARFASERSQSVQKDEEILLLKTQLADAQAEAESSRSHAQKLAEEKMALLVKVEQERANSADYKASCHWAVKYLEGGGEVAHKPIWFRVLAAMSTFGIAGGQQSFVDVVKCTWALVRRETDMKQHENEAADKCLAAQEYRAIGVDNGGVNHELACHPEGTESQPDYFP